MRSHSPSLSYLAELIRLAQIPVTSGIPIKTNPDWQKVMSMTLLLPTKIFGFFNKKIVPVGVSDLLLVKQHLYRYEPGEIARVENILSGEEREHTLKHSLSNEKETFIQTENEVQTDEELSITDHVNLKNEIESTLKEDTKVDAGTSVKVSGSGYEFGANLGVSYSKSTTEGEKNMHPRLQKMLFRKRQRRLHRK